MFLEPSAAPSKLGLGASHWPDYRHLLELSVILQTLLLGIQYCEPRMIALTYTIVQSVAYGYTCLRGNKRQHLIKNRQILKTSGHFTM